MNFPWPEWSACLVAAIAIGIAMKRDWKWSLAGTIAILGAQIAGSAGVFLLPSLAATLLPFFKLPSKWSISGALALLAAGAGLCWLFPEPAMPPLRGPHKVGTRIFEIPAEGDAPKLCFQVWYPAGNSGREFAPWLPDPALAPSFPFHRLGKASSRSWSNVPLINLPHPFPILFYEHAWMGHRAENVAQVERLANNGFVVIAVDHPGQASTIRYADGSRISGRLISPPDLSSDQAVVAFKAGAERSITERANDLARVRRAIASNLIPEWQGRLRLDHGGVFGFSFGGTTAIRLCSIDPWFQAGANEDGFVLDANRPKGPFLYFDDELPAWLKQPAAADETPEQSLIRRSEEFTLEAAKAPGCDRLELVGTRHESFTDRIFLCPIPRLAKAGRRPAVEIHHTIASALADFFTRELKPDQEAAGTR